MTAVLKARLLGGSFGDQETSFFAHELMIRLVGIVQSMERFASNAIVSTAADSRDALQMPDGTQISCLIQRRVVVKPPPVRSPPSNTVKGLAATDGSAPLSPPATSSLREAEDSDVVGANGVDALQDRFFRCGGGGGFPRAGKDPRVCFRSSVSLRALAADPVIVDLAQASMVRGIQLLVRPVDRGPSAPDSTRVSQCSASTQLLQNPHRLAAVQRPAVSRVSSLPPPPVAAPQSGGGSPQVMLAKMLKGACRSAFCWNALCRVPETSAAILSAATGSNRPEVRRCVAAQGLFRRNAPVPPNFKRKTFSFALFLFPTQPLLRSWLKPSPPQNQACSACGVAHFCCKACKKQAGHESECSTLAKLKNEAMF